MTGEECRLEDILTNLYKLKDVTQINFHQYVPNKADTQWSIQAELFLRKKDPTVLAALFSRELWCFSIDDDPLPKVDFESGSGTESQQPERKGHFTPEFSKPNLPTPYAIFMKALRRMIYVNLTLSSNKTIIPFGNSCIFQESHTTATKILHFDPHLFENGNLTVAVCSKDMGLTRLNEETLKAQVAVYLAPSGIRVYLPSNELGKCHVQAPKNAQMFLKTLLISHGINLTDVEDLKWIKVIPNSNHLNGFTPTISRYLDGPSTSSSIVWPECLCYVQTASDPKSDQELSTSNQPKVELDDCFDMIDNFIQLKLTSAYRTPGTSGGIGTLTGHNALSTGGVFTDQFQGFSKNSGHTTNIPSTGEGSKMSPEFNNDVNITPLKDGRGNRQNFTAENFSATGFITTPIINENITPTVDDIIVDTPSVNPQNDLWIEKKDIMTGISNNSSNENPSSNDNKELSAAGANTATEQDVTMESTEGVDFDKDLFGEESDEEGTNKASNGDIASAKEITDEMFDMAEDDEEFEASVGSSSKQVHHASTISTDETVRRTRQKRTYLDIPADDITIETTPGLYEDPGAPLPIETPKDRKKSVYAPLNFNPIFESNVDNKYKHGGKFSFNPNDNDEPIQFGVSTSNVSSSEEEDSDFSPTEFNNGVSAGKVQPYDPNDNDIPVVETSAYEPLSKDSLPELIDAPSSSKDDSVNASYNMTGSLMEKPMKSNLEAIWKSSTTKKSDKSPGTQSESPEKNTTDNTFVSASVQPYYYEGTGSLNSDQFTSNAKSMNVSSSLLPFTDSVSKPENAIQSSEQEQSESSKILPYLLRHMPLFSLPDVFLSQNPSIPPGKDLDDILDILTDEIVFNSEMFSAYISTDNGFKGINDCSNGIVFDTMKGLFGSFNQVLGNEVIDEIFHLPEPSVCVKKGDSMIKIKSSSYYFAEYLNLKPNRGAKNFRALFLSTEAKNDCMSFICQMSQTYSNSELGFCELTKLTNEDSQGLVYLKNFNQDTLLLLSAQIVSFCSTALSNIKSVPLLIFLPVKERTLVECISMILKFHLIRKEVKSKLPKADILLRLVDLHSLKNPLTPVSSYSSLCMSIYNSLPPKSTKFTSISSDLPRQIEFRTLRNSSTSIHYDNYIHLAYLRSIDREWLSAAWSDTKVSESFVKNWYVGNSRTRFEQVCNEIWKITLQLAAKKFGNVCLVLTRLDSVLPDDELIHWRRLSVATKDLHLAVVCVGENTKLFLFDEDKTYPTFKNLYRTNRTSSTEYSAGIDDYEIVNIDEEVHGLMFSSPLQLANSQHRCAIKSGALIRFGKSEGNRFLDKFEVNLLNCPHADSSTLLKEILKQYRYLAGANSWMGVSYGSDSFIPWHVVAVKNVMKAVVHVKSSFEKETHVID